MAPTARRRLIGPGTVVALAGALAVGLWNTGYLRPRAEPPVNAASESRFTPPPGPDIALVLDEGERLKLTPEQTEQLQAIQAEWLKESTPLVRSLRDGALEMRKYMNDAGKRRPAMDEIQKQAQPLSEASAEYARLREEYQERTLSALTLAQAALWGDISREKRNSK